MRQGFNPNKDTLLKKSDAFHQILLPVHIPKQEGYFKDSLAILKICIESIIKTSHHKTYISVVANSCCPEVLVYLENLYKNNSIHELICTTAIGKLNAVLKAIIGHSFDLVTITDADVLFLKNWQSETYKVFAAFKRAGVVCPTPSSRSFKTYTANIFWKYFFSSKLGFTEVQNPVALQNFANSVGNSNFYNPIQLQKFLTISNNSQQAVLGAGHFAATYRGEIFDSIKNKNAQHALGGNSEKYFLDIPVIKYGFWRLSTPNNYAYHMGNVLEDWMEKELKACQNSTENMQFILPKVAKSSRFAYFLTSKIFGKFILNKKVLYYFFRCKGLNKQEASNYLR